MLGVGQLGLRLVEESFFSGDAAAEFLGTRGCQSSLQPLGDTTTPFFVSHAREKG